MVTEKNRETSRSPVEPLGHGSYVSSEPPYSAVISDRPQNFVRDEQFNESAKPDNGTDSDFDEHDVSAGEDDDSIPADEDAADEEEVSNLVKESQMSLDELLATYGLPASNINSTNLDLPSCSNGRQTRRQATRPLGRRTVSPTNVPSTPEVLEDSTHGKKLRRLNVPPYRVSSIPNETIGKQSDQNMSNGCISVRNRSSRSPLHCNTTTTVNTTSHSVPCSHTSSPISQMDAANSSPVSPSSNCPQRSKDMRKADKKQQDQHFCVPHSTVTSNPENPESPLFDLDGDIGDESECKNLRTSLSGSDDFKDSDVNNSNQDDFSTRFWKCAIAGEDSPPSYNSDEDEDYTPSEESGPDWKGEVRVGDEYQANVPWTTISDDVPDLANSERFFIESRLLWEPTALTENQVVDYERTYAHTSSSALPSDHTVDDEEALFLLMQCNFDTDEAIQRLQFKTVAPVELPPFMDSWSEPDCTAFEKGFALCGKDFRQIRETRLKHKTVAELVHFYYLWKKTARYDEFARVYRRDKKKSYTNITDFMDCLALEQEVLAESYGVHNNVHDGSNTDHPIGSRLAQRPSSVNLVSRASSSSFTAENEADVSSLSSVQAHNSSVATMDQPVTSTESRPVIPNQVIPDVLTLMSHPSVDNKCFTGSITSRTKSHVSPSANGFQSATKASNDQIQSSSSRALRVPTTAAVSV